MGTRVFLAGVVLAVFVSPALGATWYVDVAVETPGDGLSWGTAFQTIQEGIDAASDGDTVVVAEGFYVENIRFNSKNIILTSTDPPDSTVVANTVIAGGGWGSVVKFSGAEDETCLLCGFTIRNGSGSGGDWGSHGGGISGGGWGTRTHATIRNNVVTRNMAVDSGGGLAYCDGLIQNNVVSHNSAYNGGGLSTCGGVIEYNTIVFNEAKYGAGLCGWDGNLAGREMCGATVRNNIIVGNRAEWWSMPGIGGGLSHYDGVIENNLVCNNTSGYGGGLAYCGAVLQNNTIIGNRGSTGGGLYFCGSIIRNCIIWGTKAGTAGNQLDKCTLPSYCCIEGWTGEGEGNIAADPRFLSAENGDFRLRADSPCIDAGFNHPDLPEFDIAGMRRIMFGGKSLTVDMGAYEFYINKLEPVPGTNEAVFTWSSLADRTYSILYTDDLFNSYTAIDNFPSSGNQTTSWTDDGALTGIPPLLAPRRFYRVLENP
jgi:hypothetical protein